MSGITDFAEAAQGLAEALRAATTDPADAVRVLASLADYTPNAATARADAGAASIGAAMATMQDACGDLFRRAAVVSLCRACTGYQPSSFDDAVRVRAQVCALLDAEIALAGDLGADATFNALRSLRATVVQDLTQRGADLAELMTVRSAGVMPAPAIAQRVYRDARRADELVLQANVIHPAFMPVSFTALAK